ncbi:Putative Cytochrome c-554 (Modular protein) [Nitrospina watsonii]|uniref:Cytochrome c-554 (Modular protein) n=1 Tax=Nitrospina watsonii TaxID=1323948 RepID=A0ABM9HDF9_9BACT|nr:Putative Cytochrome c-554 (Modular protein) [Nitrospina watsonii]
MAKVFKSFGYVFLSLCLFLSYSDTADAAKKKVPKRPKYVGATKCDGSCHDPYYQAWKNSPHGKTYELLKAGVRPDAKKEAGLDPEKDYTTDPACLRCHTTGYRQRGGFIPQGTMYKGRDVSSRIDPTEPNFEQVGCEMCHSVAGGSQFRVVMKNTKGDFKKSDIEKYGKRWDYKNVCNRCHGHNQSPHKGDKMDAEKALGTAAIHDWKKYLSEDNADQDIVKDGKVKDREKETAVSQEKSIVIENWKIHKGKLRFLKDGRAYDYRKDKVFYK